MLDTIILPVAVEVVMLPMMLAHRRRTWLFAATATAGAVAGALLCYLVGLLLLDSVGWYLIDAAGAAEEFETFRAAFDSHGFWVLVVGGLTPVPLSLVTLAAGAAGYPVLLAALAVGLARGLRYFGVGLLVTAFGPSVLAVFKRPPKAWLVAAVAMAALGVAVYAAAR